MQSETRIDIRIKFALLPENRNVRRTFRFLRGKGVRHHIKSRTIYVKLANCMPRCSAAEKQPQSIRKPEHAGIILTILAVTRHRSPVLCYAVGPPGSQIWPPHLRHETSITGRVIDRRPGEI